MRLFRKKPRKVTFNPTAGDALVEIANEDKGALKLVGDIMERNAEQAHTINQTLLEQEKRAHDETKRQLRKLQHALTDTEDRIQWLLGGPLPASLRDEVEDIIEQRFDQAEVRIG